MAYNIDTIVIDFIKSNETSHINLSNKRIAIIGEIHRKRDKLNLLYRLKTQFNLDYNNIKVFTHKHLFTKKDIINFDLLISVRGCDVEDLIINSTKPFILLPCNCGNVHVKVIKWVRNNLNIKLWIAPEHNDIKGFYDRNAWYILYNY